MTPAEMQKRLEEISIDRGVAYCRYQHSLSPDFSKGGEPNNCCARNPMVSNDYSMATSYGMSDHRRFRSPTFQ
jgi:hypothetical protein